MKIPSAVTFAAVLLFSPCLPASGLKSTPAFPEELRGDWEGDVHSCIEGESSDSDVRMAITATHRHEYEDVDRLVAIRRAAVSPATWHVVMRSDLGESVSSTYAKIFVLTGDTLIVAGGGHWMNYQRCTTSAERHND